MGAVEVVWKPDAAQKLQKDPVTREALRGAASRVLPNVNAPHDNPVHVRAGISRRGAYAQIIMRGPGALAVEFGTRFARPLAPLRRALRIAVHTRRTGGPRGR